MELARPVRPVLTYGTYPLLALLTAAGSGLAITRDLDRTATIGVLTLLTIVVAFTVERVNPLLDRWKMTKESFVRRDLPFIGLGFVVEQLATMGVGVVAALTVAPGGFGPLSRLPLAAQALIALLFQDLLWYAYHRAAHTFGRLWRVHFLHHSPSQVYVLMHPVFHPLDLIVSRLVISLIVFRFSGLTPDAAFIALAVLGLQQTVSHVNTDMRTGWLNYLLIGAETHRYHHAAGERVNYGAAVPIWDMLFGTFVYRPQRVPEMLGLEDPAAYPDPRRFLAALAYPFRSSA